LDQVPLILRRKQEDEPPRQDCIEGPVEKSRIPNSLANHRCVGQIAPERFNEGWCRIDAEDVETFEDEGLGNGKTRAAA
jgi:hypothetical protein